MKLYCNDCGRYAYKLYRKVGDDLDLICKDCLLRDGPRKCENYTGCGNPTPSLYPVYDCDGTCIEALCKSCFLSAAEADDFEIDAYRDDLKERARQAEAESK